MILLCVLLTEEAPGRMQQRLWGEESKATVAEEARAMRIRRAIERELNRPANDNNCTITISGAGAEAMVRRLAEE